MYERQNNFDKEWLEMRSKGRYSLELRLNTKFYLGPPKDKLIGFEHEKKKSGVVTTNPWTCPHLHWYDSNQRLNVFFVDGFPKNQMNNKGHMKVFGK